MRDPQSIASEVVELAEAYRQRDEQCETLRDSIARLQAEVTSLGDKLNAAERRCWRWLRSWRCRYCELVTYQHDKDVARTQESVCSVNVDYVHDWESINGEPHICECVLECVVNVADIYQRLDGVTQRAVHAETILESIRALALCAEPDEARR